MAKKKSAKRAPARRAKKATKEEEVEQSMSLLLGNMPPSRDLLYHMDTIAGLMDRARTAQSKVSDAKKKAKEAGVEVSAIMDVLKETRMDPLDLAARLRQKQMLYREKGLPVQLALYEPKFGSIEEQAKHEGYNAGTAGRSPDMERWPEGTPGHPDYMRGWNDGQRQLVEDGQKGD